MMVPKFKKLKIHQREKFVLEYECPVGDLLVKKIPFFPLMQPVRKGSGSQSAAQDSEEIFSGHITLEEYQVNQAFEPLHECHNSDCNHFPALVHEDGSPWVLGNLYIMSLAKKYPQPHDNTLYKTAQALKDLWEVLRAEGIGMFDFPTRTAKRSTYAYRNHWKRVVDEDPDAEGGANEKISKITSFYEWAEREEYFKPERPMWIASEARIVFTNSYGREGIKIVRKTDLAVKSSAASSRRKLQPYDESSQIAIEQALEAIDNTEMSLAFFMSLTTSARKQTVLTMKRSAFDSYTSQDPFVVRVGLRSTADTKKQKRFDIYIPGWLSKQIVVYMKSARYLTRLNRMAPSSDQDYVFITKDGQPYYARKNDPHRNSYQAVPVGKAVDAFIRQQLNPRLRDMGYQVRVRFHNLRSTYANNLVRGNLARVNAGDMLMSSLVTLVMERLGQSSHKDAEKYIGDIQMEELAYVAQERIEARLQAVLENSALGDILNDNSDNAAISPTNL
ncbi:site-specific integrase [Pseudomonas sp. D4002]|uniref:site-specific integrase n=1 Tax=Pseudomonas sp. D4002 TaxID=2738817 RepID=UPI0015A3E463|nr:site-specific integrase [Pseudomonas sp. D4002]NWB24082.1 site-specific integrase [Pseudomonas sp. D4002]